MNMVVRQYSRGHEIYYDSDDGVWLYSDDDSLGIVERHCKKCGHMPLPIGEDYCLGHIGGVKYACCGHGVDVGYIVLNDGRRFVEDK